MNLLMTAPLRDSRGVIRYFIGAQVDVSGLVKECSDLESLRRLTLQSEHRYSDLSEASHEIPADDGNGPPVKDEFQELSEMMNLEELDTVRRWGGRMHREAYEKPQSGNQQEGSWNKPRLLINSTSPDGLRDALRASGKLSGIFEHYLLVRPYPSLRVLFASPSLRVPGILQSPFMNKIGGSQRVRDDLTRAMADARGVTARVRWVSKTDPDGYSRWIHCTPLIGSNGAVGVWMVVIVDDEANQLPTKQFKQAPAIDPKYGRSVPFAQSNGRGVRELGVHKEALTSQESLRAEWERESEHGERDTSGRSEYSLRID
jgi:hypothetical protein